MAGVIKPRPFPNSDESLTPQLIGQYVRAKRTQANLRIDDAAALCGVAKDTLSKIEKGQDTVQIGSILKVLRGFGLELHMRQWDDE